MAGYGMAEDTELATLNRRVAVLEEDVKGEKEVSRHILRKVTENENLLLETRRELRGEIAELAKKVSALHDELVLSRADVAETVGKIVAAVMREELSRRR
jgi:enhancing lycopene biosynthesis protein 2